MAVLTEKDRLGDIVKWEVDGSGRRYCREKKTFASGGAAVDLGSVVAEVTATGKFVQLNPAGADGSQIAAGIVVSGPADPSAADVPNVVVLLRGPAMIAPSKLIWPDAITEPQKATALSQLEAAGIITVEEL